MNYTKLNLKYFIYFLLILLSSCGREPTLMELGTIINSNEYVITPINYHGSIVGESGPMENHEKWRILKSESGARMIYEYYEDSTIIDLSKEELIEIEEMINSWFIDHNSNKKYTGCCFCSNMNYQLNGNGQTILMKPEGESEFALLDLQEKYGLNEKQNFQYEDL